MATQSKTKEKEDSNEKLIKENTFLKTKIAYSIGSLETVNYLIKNSSPELLQKNLAHLKTMVDRVLTDLKKEI